MQRLKKKKHELTQTLVKPCRGIHSRAEYFIPPKRLYLLMLTNKYHRPTSTIQKRDRKKSSHLSRKIQMPSPTLKNHLKWVYGLKSKLEPPPKYHTKGWTRPRCELKFELISIPTSQRRLSLQRNSDQQTTLEASRKHQQCISNLHQEEHLHIWLLRLKKLVGTQIDLEMQEETIVP
jgi:hypothetical protein